VHPIGELNRKGGLGSYYSIKDYRGINPEFGTLDDFKSMLAKAHSLGMKVIIDWVANHTAWDHHWAASNPEYYTRDSLGNMVPPIGTDWSDVADLNYDEPGLRNAMLEEMKFWIGEVGIDGFRCDVADWVPLDFWQTARRELENIKPVFMLAESENPEHHLAAFNATYSWELFHLMVETAAGHMHISVLDSMFEKNAKRFLPEDYRLNFITNHDENTWKGTADSLLGDGQKAYAVLTFTIPGAPLIYSGQEANNRRRLAFFEKDLVEWGDYEHQDFYTALIRLKNENPSLWNGIEGGEMIRLETGNTDQIYAFKRVKGTNEVIVYLNLSSEPATFKPGTDLDGTSEFFSGENGDSISDFSLSPWEYLIFVR
jgi:glycosidase